MQLGLTLSSQILSVTCDNASNNNTMIKHLLTFIESFTSTANQTRCFTHILDLVAKSILCQFDTPKKAAQGNSRDFDDAKDALAALAQELEDNKAAADDDTEEKPDGDETGGEDDNEDGLVMGMMGCQMRRWLNWRKALFQFG